MACRDDIELLQQSVKEHRGNADLRFDDRYPDRYDIKITKVYPNGKFEGRLIDIAPCI